MSILSLIRWDVSDIKGVSFWDPFFNSVLFFNVLTLFFNKIMLFKYQ